MPDIPLRNLIGPPDITLSPKDELDFQQQFIARSRRLGLNEDPDNILQLFRSRAQFEKLRKEKKRFANQDHLSGEFKLPGHPTQFKFNLGRSDAGAQLFGDNAELEDLLRGDPSKFINTITGKPATKEDFFKAVEIRMALMKASARR
jgi:hypothetical protein